MAVTPNISPAQARLRTLGGVAVLLTGAVVLVLALTVRPTALLPAAVVAALCAAAGAFMLYEGRTRW